MKTVCVLCALIALTGCQPKQDRYKIITQGSIILKMDTETGDTWRWAPDYSGTGGTWKAVKTEP
jgi:hypothetical protein